MAVVLVWLFAIACVSMAFSVSNPHVVGQSPSVRRFGFWVSGNVIGPPFYTSSQLANAMFFTPPYPSSAEFMMFGPQQDLAAGYTTPGSGPSTTNDLNTLNGIASVTDAYPNIEINVMIALGDLGKPTALSYFQYYLKSLAPHPSFYSFGLEGEYSSNVTVSNETPLMQAAQAAGKQYIDYYKDSGIAPQIAHFNCPQNQNPDECGLLLTDTGSGYVGVSAGYDAKFPFPGTCPLPSNLYAPGQNGCGWTPGYVGLVLSLFVQPSASSRLYDHFTAGASSSGSFVGVSGKTTNQMWDNPTLRGWIWNNSNYQSNFILSTSGGPTSASTQVISSVSNTFSSQSETTGTTPTITTSTISSQFSSTSVESLSLTSGNSTTIQNNGDGLSNIAGDAVLTSSVIAAAIFFAYATLRSRAKSKPADKAKASYASWA